ncbi:MAG: metal-dependent hydrolase [Halobacteriota archaeon]
MGPLQPRLYPTCDSQTTSTHMPDPFVHITVSVLALWLFYNKKYRHYALYLFPLAVFPDIDHLIPNEHRMLFHNLFILVPVISAALYARFKTKNTALYHVMCIASFLLLSHLLLDFFTDAGMPLLYPLVATKYCFTYEILLNHGSVTLIPEPPAAFVQSEVWGILLVGIALPLVLFIKKHVLFAKSHDIEAGG